MVTREEQALERELELEGWELPVKRRSFARDVALGVVVGLGAVLVSTLVAAYGCWLAGV
jgi:hypothetical protein